MQRPLVNSPFLATKERQIGQFTFEGDKSAESACLSQAMILSANVSIILVPAI